MNFYTWLFSPRGVVSRRPRLPRGVACDADADKQPKNETLAEHMEHCEAKPDNCPFEKKAVKEAEREDSISAPLGSPSPVVKEQPNEETPEQREARERDEVVKRYENPNGSKKPVGLKPRTANRLISPNKTGFSRAHHLLQIDTETGYR